MRYLALFLFSLFLINEVSARAGEIYDAQDQSAELVVMEAGITPELEQEVYQAYSYVDQAKEVPQKLLSEALAYFHAHRKQIPNQRFLAVVDFSRHSSKQRMFLVDLATGAVKSIHVAHGKGSDQNNDGFATLFSNRINSEASSIGFYLTGETYNGDHGRSLRLDGLSSTNSNARQRFVVVHGAGYVREADIQAGRSQGCLAVSMGIRDSVIDMLKGGALIYANR